MWVRQVTNIWIYPYWGNETQFSQSSIQISQTLNFIGISTIGLVWKLVHHYFWGLLQDCHPALGDVIPNAGSEPRIEISTICLVWKHVHHHFWNLLQDCHPALEDVIPQCWIWPKNWNQHHWFSMEACASPFFRLAPGFPSSIGRCDPPMLDLTQELESAPLV